MTLTTEPKIHRRPPEREHIPSELESLRALNATLPAREPWQDFPAVPLDPEATAVARRLIAERERDSEPVTPKLYKSAGRGSASLPQREWCPRAQAVMRRTGDTVTTVYPECRSRTCDTCRPVIDERDIGRVTHAFDGMLLYVAEVPIDRYRTVSQKARRHGAHYVKMATPNGHDIVVVLASEPLTDSAREVPDDARETLVRDVVSCRPPGTPPGTKGTPRPTLTGRGLPTVADWERMHGIADTDPEAGESVELHPAVTPEGLAEQAEGLGLTVERPHPRVVRILARWDAPEMVTLRQWARDPEGFLWEAMLRSTAQAQGVLPLEEPPDDAYPEWGQAA